MRQKSLTAVFWALIALLVVSSCASATQLDNKNKESVLNVGTVNSRDARSRTSNYIDIIRCAGQLDFGCVLDKSEDVLLESHNRFLVEADSQAVSRKSTTEDETPSALIESISSIFAEISELFKGGITGMFRDAKEDDSEESEELEEVEDDDEKEKKGQEKSRGINGVARRKKKKKKLKAIIKLLVLGVVLSGKITLLLKILAAHLQVKFLLIALAGLVLNAARFYLDLKKGHSPQKVIYYEHAQHQHHYDGGEEEGWGGGGGGGGSHGGYWGRSYDLTEDKKTAQDIAYAQSKPGGTAYTRVDDKPNFSWL